MPNSTPESTMKWLEHLTDQNVLVEVRSIHLGAGGCKYLLTGDPLGAWNWGLANSGDGKTGGKVTITSGKSETSSGEIAIATPQKLANDVLGHSGGGRRCCFLILGHVQSLIA